MFNQESEIANYESKLIDYLIQNEAKNLVFEIVRECGKKEYKNILLLFGKDEKFKGLLEEVRNEFKEGYGRLHLTV